MEYTKECPLPNGGTLLLRHARREEAETVLAYFMQVAGESDNLLQSPGSITMTVEQEAAFIESYRESTGNLLLCGWLDGTLVALGSLTVPAPARISHHGELAISVLKSHWRGGVGGAVMRALIGAAGQSGLHSVDLGVRADNAPAIALYKKLGFAEFGRYPDFFCINGTFYDEVLMRLPLDGAAHKQGEACGTS